MIEPSSRFVLANGLQHHVLTWTPKVVKHARPILIAHGFLDFAWSFHFVASELASRGHVVHAMDWRGHGQTEWIGKGGYYHFVDYLLDLTELTEALDLTISGYGLIGHSMGGTACAMFAGTRPLGLEKLALLEGMGPPAEEEPEGDDPRLQQRIDEWLSGVQKLRAKNSLASISGKKSRPIKDLAEALARLRVMHPTLDEERGLFLAEKATVLRDGERYFAFDPMHRTSAPIPFRVATFRPQLARIAVKTLVLNGELGWKPPDHATRIACIPDHEEYTVPKAGHMMHWDAPAHVSELLDGFFR